MESRRAGRGRRGSPRSRGRPEPIPPRRPWRSPRRGGRRRWTGPPPRSGGGDGFADQVVAVGLDDAHRGEAPGDEGGRREIHHAVDLRRLARESPLPGEGRILGRTVYQDGMNRAEELSLG